VRGSARKGVQLFWPTVSSWARGKGTLYIRVAGGHLCSLLTRPLGFFIEINVSLSSVLVSALRFSSCLVVSRLGLSCPCPAPISEQSAVSPPFVRTTYCSCLRLRFSSLVLVFEHKLSPGFTEYHSSCPAVRLGRVHHFISSRCPPHLRLPHTLVFVFYAMISGWLCKSCPR
jgi:hypothetical protein